MLGPTKGNNKKDAEWQGWKSVNRSLASSFHEQGEEGRHYRKSPDASSYLEELTSVGTQ
jgi:hypothetical protein